MLGKTHIMMSMIGVAPLIIYSPPWALIYVIAGGALGAIFPDIDEPQSMIGRRTIIISNILRIFVKHRGITHTLLAFILYSMCAVVLFKYYQDMRIIWAAAAFIIGNIVHVMGDMMTLGGVSILGPFSEKKLHLLPKGLRLKTGGLVERFMVLPLFSIVVVYVSYFKINTVL